MMRKPDKILSIYVIGVVVFMIAAVWFWVLQNRYQRQVFSENDWLTAHLTEAQVTIMEQDRIIDRMFVPYDFLISCCQALDMSEFRRESEMPENRNNPDYMMDANGWADLYESIEEAQQACLNR